MRFSALLLAAVVLTALPANGQVAARLEATSPNVRLGSADSLRLSVIAFDSAGNRLEDVPIRFGSSDRRMLPVSRDGMVTASYGGDYTVTAVALDGGSARVSISVTVLAAPISMVMIRGKDSRLVVGEEIDHVATVTDRGGLLREELSVAWASSDPSIASVDRQGRVTAHSPGSVTIRASAGGVTGERPYRVVANTIDRMVVRLSADSVRTGDVVHATSSYLNASGEEISDIQTSFAWTGTAVESAAGDFPPAEIDDRGRFVAYRPGTYRVMAVGPGSVASAAISVTARNVSRPIELVGQGAVHDVHTSDLWLWEGSGGRDYAITGTWGANGATYFWEVTDPAAPVLIDSVIVDARTVNDVKVSEDGDICVLSREGASNRRNGLVIVDCSNPHEVEVLSTFDDDLTGGVHNVFIYRDHIYAVNNGRKYDIINIEDPRNPHRVGVFELDTPGHGIHDVWVVDGIAYSSNWSDGTVMVDVGNGVAGGSPSNPVEIGRAKAVGGRNHAVFPYKSPTGRTYLFMGDESFPYGLNTAAGGTPNRAAGYIHIVDVTDPDEPEEVARYEVPEAGSHNLWIEGDTLYAAFYNGGVRVVDISGELKGNLYHQGREVAMYLPYDPDGVAANAPFVWGPQPFKGNLFFSDWNSGLWGVKVNRPPALTP